MLIAKLMMDVGSGSAVLILIGELSGWDGFGEIRDSSSRPGP